MNNEWITITDGIGTVGVTQSAQKELGEVVYVELPEVGKQVKEGEEVAVLESTKAAVDIYSPSTGIIVAVNTDLSTNATLVNTSPEECGWLYKIDTRNSVCHQS